MMEMGTASFGALATTIARAYHVIAFSYPARTDIRGIAYKIITQPEQALAAGPDARQRSRKREISIAHYEHTRAAATCVNPREQRVIMASRQQDAAQEEPRETAQPGERRSLPPRIRRGNIHQNYKFLESPATRQN